MSDIDEILFLINDYCVSRTRGALRCVNLWRMREIKSPLIFLKYFIRMRCVMDRWLYFLHHRKLDRYARKRVNSFSKRKLKSDDTPIIGMLV